MHACVTQIVKDKCVISWWISVNILFGSVITGSKSCFPQLTLEFAMVEQIVNRLVTLYCYPSSPPTIPHFHFQLHEIHCM